MKCGHRLNSGVVCEKPPGHSGTHQSASIQEGSFAVCEWNDNGETAVDEMGRAFSCDYDDGYAEREKIMSLAVMDAKSSLPPGAVFEIRAKEYPRKEGKPGDYGEFNGPTRRDMAKNWGIAWYVRPKQPVGFEFLETATRPLFQKKADDGEYIEMGGYVLLARIQS